MSVRVKCGPILLASAGNLRLELVEKRGAIDVAASEIDCVDVLQV
jgi:hypothetical protein